MNKAAGKTGNSRIKPTIGKAGEGSMKTVNVLILSAGRRVELIHCFKDARERLGISGKVVAVDLSKTAPALYHAEGHHLVPPVGSSGYIDELIRICTEEDIHLMIPTIDTELKVLSKNRERIEEATNAKVMISDPGVIGICRDKNRTSEFFREAGVKTPENIDPGKIAGKDLEFPLFIKPLDGSSSINAFQVRTMKELEFFKDYVPNPIIQRFTEGDEYTIDAFCDFQGRIIHIVPRLRIATRGGEISKGKVVKDREIIGETEKVLKALKPMGHITLQCIRNDQGIYFIEINPRFGGGAPISIKAGADSPENLYRLLSGETLEYNEDYQDRMMALRYDAAVFLNERDEMV